MTNPVLVEVTRGGLIESRHRGAIAVARADGSLVWEVGEIEAPVYPRSAVKVLQAIPLIESGAADVYGFADGELALACSSHSGEPRHTELAASMLERAGLAPDSLECGAHKPIHEATADALVRAGEAPQPLHNNCSGKHAGMLATAMRLGEAPAGYVHPDHGVQRRIAGVIEDLTGLPLAADICGVDGCSVPTWALPLSSLAKAFALLAAGPSAASGKASGEHVAAGHRLIGACMAEPGMVAGKRRLCTRIMQALPGVVFAKTGAEGVYCAALPKAGLGIALKIDDGASRASEIALASVLASLHPAGAEALAPFESRSVHSVRGAAVGEVRPTSDWAILLAAGSA